MIRSCIALLAVGMLLPGAVSAEEGSRFVLRRDASKPVITFDVSVGSGMPGWVKKPALLILGDGTVRVANIPAPGTQRHGTVTREEVDELLSFMIVENAFFEYSPVAVQQQMEALDKVRPPGPGAFPFAPGMVRAAPPTLIRVDLADRSQEVSVPGLKSSAARYAQIKALQQLVAISSRLSHLRQVIAAGGRQQVLQMLERVNAELKKQFPKEEPLKFEHFECVRSHGTITTLEFQRRGEALPATDAAEPDRAASKRLQASVQLADGGPPRIAIRRPVRRGSLVPAAVAAPSPNPR